MADKKERIRIFEESMSMCETNDHLHQSVQDSLYGQKIYWENDTLPKEFSRHYDKTEIRVSSERTCAAARDYKDNKICILNFASFVTPGGGVVRGAGAQEESICRISTLYKCIADSSVSEFYKSHWDKINSRAIDRRNNDDIIYTPGVTVFKEDTFDCSLMTESEWYNVDVITCAAPDLRRAFDSSRFSPADDELMALHEKRWRRILTVASMHNAEILILGAFGCGVFDNPPQIVAQAASKVCGEFTGCFEKIIFAVFTNSYENDNYRAFSQISNLENVSNIEH